MLTPSEPSASLSDADKRLPLPSSKTVGMRRSTNLLANLRALLALLVREWRWLIVFGIYLLGWYTPFTDHGTSGDGPARWCWQDWYSINFTLGFALYVPLLVALVIWVRRDALTAYWNRIVSHFPPGHKNRQGSIVPLVIGCFLLFVSHFIEVKGVGVFALLFMLVAVIYRVYGPLMTRALAAPLALLIAMIPPPDHFTDDFCTHKVTTVCVKLAAGVLSAVGISAQSSDTSLHLHGYAVDIDFITCCGTNVAASVVLILWTYHLCRKSDPTLIIISFVIGMALSYTLQVGRVIAIGLLSGPQPEAAQWLMHSALVSVAMIALVSYGTVKIMRLSFHARMPESVLRAAKMTGRGMNAVTGSFDRPAGALLSAGNWWTRSERAIERWLKAMTKRKKQRRRW